MKYLIYKDNKKRLSQFESELKKNILKIIFKNKKYSISIRWSAFFNLMKITKKYPSKTTIVNRCIFTGRANGILSKFKMSRIMFLNLGRSNNLLGFKKFFV